MAKTGSKTVNQLFLVGTGLSLKTKTSESTQLTIKTTRTKTASELPSGSFRNLFITASP
jgi:hypothetical protein